MTYEEISTSAQSLGYRDKLRLAQLLLQLGRKEEEESNPSSRAPDAPESKPDPELVRYVAERLLKLKPGKKEAVLNSIGAMFQFQGGITERDKENLFSALLKGRHIRLSDSGKVTYDAPSAY